MPSVLELPIGGFQNDVSTSAMMGLVAPLLPLFAMGVLSSLSAAQLCIGCASMTPASCRTKHDNWCAQFQVCGKAARLRAMKVCCQNCASDSGCRPYHYCHRIEHRMSKQLLTRRRRAARRRRRTRIRHSAPAPQPLLSADSLGRVGSEAMVTPRQPLVEGTAAYTEATQRCRQHVRHWCKAFGICTRIAKQAKKLECCYHCGRTKRCVEPGYCRKMTVHGGLGAWGKCSKACGNGWLSIKDGMTEILQT